MKASTLSEAQKAFILNQDSEGAPVAKTSRRAGISRATQFNLKMKYVGLPPTEMKRLKQLEDENTKLRKLVAALPLDREMLQDIIRRTKGRRSQSSKACWEARAGGRGLRRVRRFDPAGLPGARDRRFHLLSTCL